MRPRTLRIEGLRSYLSEQTIDFRERDLMAVVGDTGAGKSSILEALCFALYGSASWSNKAVKELISHGRDVMRVELMFAADGHEWTLTRTAARGTHPRPITMLVSPELDLKLERKRDVDAKVQELVGLEYSAFLRAVVLPQGRFQELLQATSADRAKILKGIFRLDLLDKMREWAEDWRREREPQRATLLAARARLHEDPAAEAEAALGELQRLAAEAIQLAGARERHTQAQTRADDANARMRELERARQAVCDAPVDEIRQALARLERAQSELLAEEGELSAALERLEGEREVLRDALREREQSGLGLERLGESMVQLERAAEYARQADQAESQAESQAANLRKLEHRYEQCERARTTAESAHAEAQAAREQACRADMAVHLATHVEPGDPCPVCGEAVPASFRTGQTAGKAAGKALTQADKRVERADKAENKARQAETEARSARDSAQDALARSRETAAHARAKVRELLAGMPPAIAPAIALGDHRTEAIEHALERAHAYREERQIQTEQLSALDTNVQAGREDLHALDARRIKTITMPARDAVNQLNQRADILAPLAHLLDGAPPESCLPGRHRMDADENPAALLDEMRAYADLLERETERMLAAVEEMHQTVADEHQRLLREAGDAIAQAGHDRLEGLIKRIGANESEQRAQTVRQREAGAQIERAARLDQCIGQATDLCAAVDEVRKLLADGKFIAYAVERKQRALLSVASQLISDMSGGRFGFAADFQIVDNHAREARSTDTLSGGETFLASLALALALVELANRTGGRLDALFLDEGFGALDADSLEQAVQALSAQAARGRLVVIISHLQAVAENIEHVLLVEATVSGSRAHELDPSERSRFDLGAAGLVT